MATFIPPPVAADGTTITSANGVLSAAYGPADVAGGTTAAGLTAGNTTYFHPSGAAQAGTITADQGVQAFVAPRAGTLRNLRSVIQAALGVGGTIVVKVRVNGADSTLTVTHPNSAPIKNVQADTTHSVAVAAGDLVTMKIQNTDASNNGSTWSMDFA